MVRKIIILLILFVSTTACWYIGKTSEYGLPRRKIRPLPENTDYSKIDTMALYKLDSYYFYNSLEKKINDFTKKENDSYPYVSYLKFYSKGKLGLFVISKQDTLNLQRYFFNPQKAKMGYYYIEGNKIKTKISTIGNATLHISRKKGFIYNDSIDIRHHNFYGNIFIKRNVPKELLEGWEPDW